MRKPSFLATVISALRRGLSLGQERQHNGLAVLAGTWSQEEFAAFERAVQDLGEAVDEEVGRIVMS